MNQPYTVPTETITGTIYADNWFEFYFNGQLMAIDPFQTGPLQAVEVEFQAPIYGPRTYAFHIRDWATADTGVEPRGNSGIQGPTSPEGLTCLGDGGFRAIFSDGTVSNSKWKCYGMLTLISV